MIKERLCKWSKNWLLGFNIKKCKLVSFGNVQFVYEYGMADTQNNLHVLSTEDSGSDLVILKFDLHIDNTVNKVNRIMGLIKRKLTYMDIDLFLSLLNL